MSEALACAGLSCAVVAYYVGSRDLGMLGGLFFILAGLAGRSGY